MSAREIVSVLSGYAFPLSNEKRTQAAIEEALDFAGIDYGREVDLGDRDIIDFRCGGVGIEVKIKGSRRDIYRQVERYAKHNAIQELILVTNVPTGFPERVSGKPVYVLNLAKAWL